VNLSGAFEGLIAGAGGHLIFGCDYNPEQWPEDVWADDMVLMREAGVNLVSVGIFAWSLLEPRDGVFEFGWLDRVVDLLHANGIRVDLATATAAIPAWLSIAHPEVQPVDIEGRTMWQGSRQNWCASSPVYRERSLRLVQQIAEHFAGHPALAMWHISNEYACHNARCYCDNSAIEFRKWLQRKYGDISALNKAWGTTFWSQHYEEFDHIQPPRISSAWLNPTQQLDYARFSSDIMLEQFRAERDVVKAVTPDIPVTTNVMVAAFGGLDYWAWAPEMDIVSNDHYLELDTPAPHIELAMSADMTRGLAGGAPWFLMEHSTSAVNWQPRNIAKQPGEMRRNTLQHIARGADAACFFQWRASLAGAEKFHSAMVPHVGTDSDIWREVVQLGGHVRAMSELVGSIVRNDVAFIFDYHARWATDMHVHPSSAVRYMDQTLAYYTGFWRLGIGVDFARPASDLSRYRLVVVPTLYLASDAIVESLKSYVRGGGHVVITYFSGITDVDDHVIPGGYPGAFRDILGVRTTQFFPLAAEQSVSLSDHSVGTLWTEDVHPEGAETIAHYVDGPLPGVPAITRNMYMAGVAWYVATRLDDDGLERLLSHVARDAQIKAAVETTAGVEIVRRHGAGGASWLFVLNHTDSPANVATAGVDVLTGLTHADPFVIAPRGVAVIREGAA